MSLDLLLDLGATHRLVRLITADTITAPPRDAVIRWAYEHAGFVCSGQDRDAYEMAEQDWTEYAIADANCPPLATLATCRWCFSVYAAFGVVALRRLAPRWWSPVATALALSSASTLLASLED